MIRAIWEHSLSPVVFLKAMPAFLGQYLTSRSLKSLLFAIPAIAITVAVVLIVLDARSAGARTALKDRYTRLSQQAVESNDLAAAETYFARVLSLSSDKAAASFEFAQQLYSAADGSAKQEFLLNPAGEFIDDSPTGPMLRRSLVLMQSLAPRQTYSNGYAPAHLFLSQFWQSRKPQTPITQTLAMQHEVAADPRDAKPAIRLAKFIAKRGYNQQALDILDTFQAGNSEVLLICGAIYQQMQRPLEAAKCFSTAEAILRKQLAQTPADVEIRQALSRTQAAQGRILESMMVLAEGCQSQQPSALIDSLIGRYTLWLTQLPKEKVSQQLQEISVALQHSKSWDSSHSDFLPQPIRTSSDEEVLLPGPIVGFHAAMLNGDGNWLIPLLLGTDAAAREDYSTAFELLSEGIEIAPDHPVIANNLAWTLFQRHAAVEHKDQLQPTEDADSGFDLQSGTPEFSVMNEHGLAEAWQLSSLAVRKCPDNISFRETHGLIAAATERWNIAESELQACISAGHYSQLTQRYLRLATQQLLSEPHVK